MTQLVGSEWEGVKIAVRASVLKNVNPNMSFSNVAR
jgi:hypothetical protein